MGPRSNTIAISATERERVKNLTDSIERRDFALTPDGNNNGDNASQQKDCQGVKLPCAYLLRETAPNILSLTSMTDPSSATYTFGPKERTKFMMKQMAREIVENYDGTSKQVVRYHQRGDHTTVLRHSTVSPHKSNISYVDHVGLDRFLCTLDRADYLWEPLGGSETVNVLSNREGKRVALFRLPIRAQFKEGDIGEIHVIDVCGGGQQMLEKIMFAIVNILERVREWLRKYRKTE